MSLFFFFWNGINYISDEYGCTWRRKSLCVKGNHRAGRFKAAAAVTRNLAADPPPIIRLNTVFPPSMSVQNLFNTDKGYNKESVMGVILVSIYDTSMSA